MDDVLMPAHIVARVLDSHYFVGIYSAILEGDGRGFVRLRGVEVAGEAFLLDKLSVSSHDTPSDPWQQVLSKVCEKRLGGKG
jgi:hypothetical protein